ncbi:MAG: hypothetical protein D6683_09675 [Actinomyces sp.]|nr:MAG: hypothetical protein D6683_09675 [Actinomyces sp.]
MLLLVVLENPSLFRLRDFRLPGVLVSAIALVVLTPLPAVVDRYGESVPDAMVLSLAAGVAGWAMVFAAAGRVSGPTRRWTGSPLSRRIERTAVLWVVAVAVAILPVWLLAIDRIPLFELLGGASGIDVALARQNALLRLSPPVLRLAVGVIRNLYLPFALAWFVSDWLLVDRRHARRRSVAGLAALVVAAVGVGYALVTTEKAVVGELAAVVVIAALVVRGRQLRVSHLAVLVPLAAAFPLLFFGLVSSGGLGERVVAAVHALWRRAFFVPDNVMTAYFREFPARHDFLAGASIPKLGNLLAGETFDLSKHIFVRYFQSHPDLLGNANAGFFGVGWANFGPAGVVVWSLLAAVGVVWLDRLIGRLPVRSAAAVRGIAVVHVVLMTSTDVWRTALGFAPGVLDLALLGWFAVWLSRRRSVPRLPGLSRLGEPIADVPVGTVTDGDRRAPLPAR